MTSLVMILCVAAAWGAVARDSASALSPFRRAAILKQADSGIVTVEFRLRYHKGQPPRATRGSDGNGQSLVDQERPFSTPGFLLSPERVVTRDLPFDQRYIERIEVRRGTQVRPAKISALGLYENALFLDLAAPLKEARPLVFTPSKGPYLGIETSIDDEVRNQRIGPASLAICSDNRESAYGCVPENYLVVDTSGHAVGLSLRGEIPLDSTWNYPPHSWPTVSAADRTARIGALRTLAGFGLVGVELTLRSPRARNGSDYDYRSEIRSARSKNISDTEARALGVRIGSTRVLVLLDLDRETTARLEHVAITDARGKTMVARFAGSLAEYGAFIAELVEPLSDSVRLSTLNILRQAYSLTYRAQVHIAGNERVAYYGTVRCIEYGAGYRGVLGPFLADDERNSFLFSAHCELLALSLPRRNRNTEGGEYDQGSFMELTSPAPLMPAAYLRTILGSLSKHLDSSNVPLREAQEGRLAWLGVVLQPLDRELARVNGVSEETREGATGGLVSFVYPQSPAANAGIVPGMVLLRIRPANRPKPIEISARSVYPQRTVDWEMMDKESGEFLDRMPPPWPVLDDELTRALTGLGRGARYEADLVADGRKHTKVFGVSLSPTHFDIAPRHKSETLGITVREVTFEVRRFFQKTDKDPGVIISKVEPGSKASVAGIIPYEIITHINGQPVRSIADFQKLIAAPGEVRLTLNLMYRTRQLNIRVGG